VSVVSDVGFAHLSVLDMVIEISILMSLTVLDWGTIYDALYGHRRGEFDEVNVREMRCDPGRDAICACAHRGLDRRNAYVVTSNENVICVCGGASDVCGIVLPRPRCCGVCAYSCGRRRLCGVGSGACVCFPACRFPRLFQQPAEAFVFSQGRSS
jgi:hypothetical protein